MAATAGIAATNRFTWHGYARAASSTTATTAAAANRGAPVAAATAAPGTSALLEALLAGKWPPPRHGTDLLTKIRRRSPDLRGIPRPSGSSGWKRYDQPDDQGREQHRGTNLDTHNTLSGQQLGCQ